MTERPKQFANREDPIPVLSFSSSEEEGKDRDEHGNGFFSGQQSPQTPVRQVGSLEVPKKRFSASVTAQRGDAGKEGSKTGDGEDKSKSWRSLGSGSGSIQDQLYKLLFQSVIASEEIGSGSSWQSTQTGAKTERPAFSLPVMSTNFRRFNARIGVAFAFQKRLMKLFSWRRPTQTLSFLAMYSFICLDPNLLPVLPIALCIFFITIPSYLVRHPAPPIQQHDLCNSSKSTHSSGMRSSSSIPTDTSTVSYRSSYFFNNFTDNMNDADSSFDSTNSPSSHPQYHLPSKSPIQTPSTNPPPTVRPTPEISRDFFRNMRDLQNSMEDFSRLHDTVIATVTPLTNFSDEARSSALFVVLALLAGLLIIARHIVPWRAILLAAGWLGTGIGHPAVRRWLMGLAMAMSTEMSPASSAAAASFPYPSSPAAKTNKVDDPPPTFRSLTTRFQNRAHDLASRWIADDIILSDTSNDAHNNDDDGDDIVVNNQADSKMTSPEKQKVEIFELQKQQSHIPSHSSTISKTNNNTNSYNNNALVSTYSPSIFSPSPFPPGSSKSSGTNTSTATSTSLSSILPPPGPFRWADQRWTLDTRTIKMNDNDKHAKGRRRRIREINKSGVMAWVRERGLQDVMGDDLEEGMRGEKEEEMEEEEMEGEGDFVGLHIATAAVANGDDGGDGGDGGDGNDKSGIAVDKEGSSGGCEDGQGWVVDLLVHDADDNDHVDADDNDHVDDDDHDHDKREIGTGSSSSSEKNVWRRRRWVRLVMPVRDGH